MNEIIPGNIHIEIRMNMLCKKIFSKTTMISE